MSDLGEIDSFALHQRTSSEARDLGLGQILRDFDARHLADKLFQGNQIRKALPLQLVADLLHEGLKWHSRISLGQTTDERGYGCGKARLISTSGII